MQPPGEQEEDCSSLRRSRRASWRTQSEFLPWTRSQHLTRATGRGQLRLSDSQVWVLSLPWGPSYNGICHVLGSQGAVCSGLAPIRRAQELIFPMVLWWA